MRVSLALRAEAERARICIGFAAAAAAAARAGRGATVPHAERTASRRAVDERRLPAIGAVVCVCV